MLQPYQVLKGCAAKPPGCQQQGQAAKVLSLTRLFLEEPGLLKVYVSSIDPGLTSMAEAPSQCPPRSLIG
jgi:hypothetical protein